MAFKNDLVKASEIYWAEWVDPEICNLQMYEDQEKIVVFQDTLDKLSDELQTIIKVIFELPDEMFFSTGQVIKSKLIKHMHDNFGWSTQKTIKIQSKLFKVFG
jgi:hypothetical protein